MESFAHDSGRNSVRAEYGYPKGSPNTNSYRRQPPLQLSIQRTPKRPSSELHEATRQQAIAETPAKWSAYQIPSVIVVFVVLLFSHAQKPQDTLNQLVTEKRYRALFYMPLYTFLHNLLNVLIQTAIKVGLQKNVATWRSVAMATLKCIMTMINIARTNRFTCREK
jgi:hypothetical protein